MSEHPKAKRAHEALTSAAKELGFAARGGRTAAARENAAMDQKACESGAELIAELDTEVFRLRQAIGCYLDGRLERQMLREISRTWNND